MPIVTSTDLFILNNVAVSDLYEANDANPFDINVVRAIQCMGCDTTIEEVTITTMPRRIMIDTTPINVHYHPGGHHYSPSEVIVWRDGSNMRVTMAPENATPEALRKAAAAAFFL